MAALGCTNTPIIELWNKIDALPDPYLLIHEAVTMPVDTEVLIDAIIDDVTSTKNATTPMRNLDEVSSRHPIVSNNNNNTTTGGAQKVKNAAAAAAAAQVTGRHSKQSQARNPAIASSSSSSGKIVLKKNNKRNFDSYSSFMDSESEYDYLTEADVTSNLQSAPQAPLRTHISSSDDVIEKERMIAINSQVVAVSVKTGLGFNRFLTALDAVFCKRFLTHFTCLFVPYNLDDGILTLVFNQGER